MELNLNQSANSDLVLSSWNPCGRQAWGCDGVDTTGDFGILQKKQSHDGGGVHESKNELLWS